MLSIKGIYDGEKIIPKEPINLEKGKQFEVIITFIEPTERVNQNVLDKFCGIWKDDRTAQKIVDEIYKQRENFNLKDGHT
jgi:predicted DNA-binding antitoxin AbrB/MazE fold protein